MWFVVFVKMYDDNIEIYYFKMLKKDYENDIGMILRCLIMKCLLV